MKKMSLALIAVLSLNATTITDLFDSLSKQSITKIDELNAKLANTGINKVKSNFYPKVDLFGNYTHYNHATNMRPATPLETPTLSKNKDLPFSQTIEKMGIKASVPIFVKSLFDLEKKAKYLAKSAKFKKQINFYQNEAVVLGANANLKYLENLQTALNATRNSILKTRNDIKISVDSGRMPGIALDKIDDKLNQIDIALNNIKIKKQNLISKISSLTGINLTHSVDMNVVNKVKTENIFALKPLLQVIKASEADYKASKDNRWYPKVAFNVMWSENYAKNIQDNNVAYGYGYYQLGISMPLYNKSTDADVEMKKIEALKATQKYAKTKQELTAEAKFLQNQMKLLQTSKKLTKKNIQSQKNLLNYAKVAFEEGRMTEEDYLKYETDLLEAKARYYEVKSQIWQTIAKLSVIYGNDLKDIVK